MAQTLNLTKAARAALGCVATAAFSMAGPAVAQVTVALPLVCAERREVLRDLAERYGENPAGRGVTNGGGLVERWQNPEQGTWTWVLITPGGLACLVAAGEGWRERRPAAGRRGAQGRGL